MYKECWCCITLLSFRYPYCSSGGLRALHMKDTTTQVIYVKLVGLIWQFSPADRINMWDSIQLSKIYAPLKRSGHYKIILWSPPTPHLCSFSSVQHQNRQWAAAHQAFLVVAFLKTHPHKDIATDNKSPNRNNYRRSFLCRYSKSGNHTGIMYDTWIILQHSIYIQEQWVDRWRSHGPSLCSSSLPLSCWVLFTALPHVLMSVNRLWRGRRRMCCHFWHTKHIVTVVLLPDACSRTQAAGICCG